jgi:hypothetical protein
MADVDRRTLLKALGTTATAAAVAPYLTGAALSGAARPASPGRSIRAMLLAARSAPLPPQPVPSFVFSAVRNDDLLNLGFQFYNAHKIVKKGQTFVVPTDTTMPAQMVVVFQSQHLGEETAEFSSVTQSFPLPPLPGALAGISWLAFELPKNAEIPLTIDGLLTWSALKPQLVPAVQNPGTGQPAPPDPLHSALEVPWSLWLSPPADGTWQHSTEPVTAGGRTELWHTRLGVNGVEPPRRLPEITAFWSSTFDSGIFTPPPPDPFTMPLSPQNRNDIVALTSGVVAGGGPAQARLFALSSLGASVNLHGSWNPSQESGVSLASWLHRASLGRDSYVRTANIGYLFPFGNRAVRVSITNREFHVDQLGSTVAYLVTKNYIVVTEPVISYAGDQNEPSGGRGNPVRAVNVKTVTPPPIDFDPNADPDITVGSLDPSLALWVRSGAIDVPFALTVTDLEGRNVDITTSAIWLDATITDPSDVGQIIAAYDGAGPARNSPSFGGALFAFADTDGAAAGSTAHYVDTYTLTAVSASNGAANFYPLLSSAAVRLPGAEQLTGAGASPLPAPSVSITPNYLSNGFQAGVTEIYLAVTNNAPGLGFPVGLVGGVAAPNFDVSGIARDLGPVAGDLSDLLAGTFDPAKYFSVLSGGIGKLLGAIPITEIIKLIDPDTPAANDQAPQITNNFIYPGNDQSKPPTALDTKLKWQPAVQADQFGFFKPSDSTLLITAEIMAPIAQPAQSTYQIHGELNNFELVLFGDAAPFIGITFTSLTFDSGTGAKTSIQPKIDSVTFLGPLTFIQDFEQLLASIGGPSIDVTAAGIDASYSLALPSISVGVFSLSNLSINAGLNIPFDGSPVRVRFGLCTQDNPFLLTCWIFGGGGYFSLALGADGIEELQVELEFGAAVSIDLGVASGGISIMAGIYFSLQTVPSLQIVLTGFLRADGNLSVLGIITLSMEFYLALTYLKPGQAYGEATVTVSIRVLFFSASVSATYRKTLGGGSDPDFKAAISPADWDTYCEAFAA